MTLVSRRPYRNYFTVMFWMWTFMVLLNLVMLNLAGLLSLSPSYLHCLCGHPVVFGCALGPGHHLRCLWLHQKRDRQERDGVGRLQDLLLGA